MLNDEIISSIEKSTLCWLATLSDKGYPNVSPKECFVHDGEGKILVANIASPRSARNIKNSAKVCLSFIDVFVQKGYKVYGKATILNETSPNYQEQLQKLSRLVGKKFKIISVIEITPEEIETIIAPSYKLLPQTTEAEMIKQSLETYKVRDLLDQG